MTFTYALADLSSADATTKNRALIRMRLGDTDSESVLLEDEEIEAVLGAVTSVPLATLQCCRVLLGAIARDVDANGAGISTNRSQRTQHYRDLLAELEAEVRTAVQPYLGGVSISRDRAIEADTDFKRPAFTRGMHDDRRGARNGAAEEGDG